jgi:hypothetical protein
MKKVHLKGGVHLMGPTTGWYKYMREGFISHVLYVMELPGVEAVVAGEVGGHPSLSPAAAGGEAALRDTPASLRGGSTFPTI